MDNNIFYIEIPLIVWLPDVYLEIQKERSIFQLFYEKSLAL